MDLILKTRYLPLEQIGWGGFGKTFRTWDAHLEQQCVVKQLQPRNTSGNPFSSSELESIKRLFEKEAKTLRDLRHEQIPQLYDYFELPTPSNSQEELFYLVQQYIQGKTLAQELNTRSRFSEDEVVRDLRQILNVLNYIHEPRRRVIHRDIKPSNIIRDENGKLYLIDFGAVKRQLEPGVPVEQSMAIRTPIFAPPEQLSGGEIFPCSDLYSLAVTCLCLLTGRSANELKNQDRWIWKEYVNVNDNLADILDRMLSYQPEDRYKSAENVITALSGQISLNQNSSGNRENPRKREEFNDPTIHEKTSFYLRLYRLIKKVFLPMGLVVLGSAIALLIHWWTHPPICDFQNQSGFSCGEQILIPQNPNITNTIFADKQRGTDAFRHEKFDEAIVYFKRYLTANKNDPEARIYLNNSQAALTNNPLKIAASVAIIDDTLNSSNILAEQMLRGLAHVQDNINQNKGINGRLLFIEIASYFGHKEKIKRIADAIASKESILGVIGYYTSEDTIETAPSYDGKMVVISPTSAAVRDSNFPLFSKYVFRTTPDNSAVAGKLVEYMRHQRRKKTAIFYEPNEKYTISFMQEFKNVLFQNQGEVVNECQVTQTLSEALNCLQQAKQSNAEVILLALSQKVADNVIIAIINQSENITILGGAPLYSESVSQANIPVDKLRSVIPWHRSNGTKSKFELESAKLWGTGDVNWRTAMSYDATMAMVEALKRSQGNYTRQRLYEALKNPAFSAEGATAKVEFNDLGDRKPLPGIGVLVKVENNRFVVDQTQYN
ncbi:bifunctional serine/threonine-protein kinase/ABC transporter substrate-binding protein [Plectonema radiosum NIES-515]|uniref:non-specific serine/threonine protein kinase n=1 Tax=Plectonema radiosum NIES-515 TaxID=2986073 RepID=A0ABT3B3A9_9CYAN|nr:bifunctional serine/threonine-protein kinase/ABC transporter substrate-binding protein [Plectonema radiosum]MCV3215475.1 bifunctional serine/threonine-protein kinase/ABC transporter substrate-binding protein [Plectonema radiosum NIES-515]